MITINDIITKIKLIFILFKCKILKLKLKVLEKKYRECEYPSTTFAIRKKCVAKQDLILDELSNLEADIQRLQVSLYF